MCFQLFSDPFFSFLLLRCSAAKSCPTLQPHGLQHPRFPCPSPTLRACSNACPSNWWYSLTISSSVVPFSCLQSCPASEIFPVSQFFTSGGQSIRVSASASLLLLTGLLFSRSGVWMMSFSLETANGVYHPRALLEADENFLACLSLILMCSRKLCFHTEFISFSASPFGPVRPYLSNIRVLFQNRSREGKKTTGRDWMPVWKMPFRWPRHRFGSLYHFVSAMPLYWGQRALCSENFLLAPPHTALPPLLKS